MNGLESAKFVIEDKEDVYNVIVLLLAQQTFVLLNPNRAKWVLCS